MLEGRVTVNGQLATELGMKVTDGDDVRVDGARVHLERKLVVLMNKPKGVVTTMDDPQGRPTVRNLIPDLGVNLRPVGRLDMDTEGLLLLTNDGDLAARLTHPRRGVEKEYEAVVTGTPDEKALESLRKGVFFEGKRSAPAKAEIVSSDRQGRTSKLRLIIHEGRKRQVRLMCECVGHQVLTLRRVRFGPLRLRGLGPGECRTLGKAEVDQLRTIVGL